MKPQTLQSYLLGSVDDAELADLIDQIADSCRAVSRLVGRASLEGNNGDTETINPQGEVQKPLDLMADEVFVRHCAPNPRLALMISEEVEEPRRLQQPRSGDFILSYDPLDGSSNLDVNLSVGSIFAISKVESSSWSSCLPSGRSMVCAGYAIYGPSTMLVLSFGESVNGFSLDSRNESFLLTHSQMTIPDETQEFAINVSRQHYWDRVIQDYVADCILGAEGRRGKSYNMRWTASMVAEVHRILIRGGVFLYPVDEQNAQLGGKLRLLYEANPMAMIVEAAGGCATDGLTPLRDLKPQRPHQRTAVVLGSRSEVDLIAQAYSSSKEVRYGARFT